MADQSASRSPEPAASQTTRQLLDDLDSLMKRMLALPVQQNEGEPEGGKSPSSPPASGPAAALPAAQPRGVNLLPVPTATVTVQLPVAEKRLQQEVPRESAPSRLPGPAPAPLQRGEPHPEPQPAPAYLPIGAEPLLPILLQRPKATAEKRPGLVLPSSISMGPTAAAPRAETLPAPRPVWHKPASAPLPTVQPEPGPTMKWFLAVNRAFDRGTTLFGGAGRWLRGDFGRTLLGWAGLAMIAVALIWAAMQFLG